MLAKERQAHVDAWQASGLSKSAYARAHDLNIKTFGRWSRLAPADSAPVPKLLPVTLKPSGSSKSIEPIRLTCGSGMMLELPASISPDWLGALLKCLD